MYDRGKYINTHTSEIEMATKNQNDFGYNITSGGYSDYIKPDAWGNLDAYQESYLNSSPEQQGLYANTASKWTDDQTQSFMDMQNDAYTNSFNNSTELGWNSNTLEGAGSVLGGIGSLASAWAGLQNVKLGEERLAMQDQQFGANFSNQATLLNNQVNKHNNWAASNPGSSTYDRVSTDYKKI